MSYKRVNDAFWGGELVLSLAGDADAFAAAFYLLTGPESTRSSIGVFRLSAAALGEALGIDSRRASEALATLSKRGFITVDKAYRMVFVVEAARHEYGEHPNVADNRVKALVKALPGLLAACPKSLVWNDFRERYGDTWAHVLPSPPEALPKPSRRASGVVVVDSPTLEARSENLETKDKTPPPPKGEKSAAKRKHKTGRKIPSVTFPSAFLQAGLTAADFARRVRTCNITKKPETWQGELNSAALRIEEHGAEVVAELYRAQFETGYHGIPWKQLEERRGARQRAPEPSKTQDEQARDRIGGFLKRVDHVEFIRGLPDGDRDPGEPGLDDWDTRIAEERGEIEADPELCEILKEMEK